MDRMVAERRQARVRVRGWVVVGKEACRQARARVEAVLGGGGADRDSFGVPWWVDPLGVGMGMDREVRRWALRRAGCLVGRNKGKGQVDRGELAWGGRHSRGAWGGLVGEYSRQGGEGVWGERHENGADDHEIVSDWIDRVANADDDCVGRESGNVHVSVLLVGQLLRLRHAAVVQWS